MLKKPSHAERWRGEEQGFVGDLRAAAAMNRHVVLLFLASAFFFSGGAAQCTFPSALQGTWLTSSNGNITITSSTVQDYPVSTFGSYTLDCNQNYGGRYILKSQTTFNLIGLVMYAYVCLDFTAVSSNLYYYYIATNFTSGYQIMYKAYWSSPTSDEVCAFTTSQYDPALYQVMVKDGDGEAAKQPCPSDLTILWDYDIDSGSGNTCSAATDLDGCTDSQLTANYTYCSTRVFYSDSGVVYCLVSLTSGSLTYLTVYNTDATVDNTNSYRMACLVYQTSGNWLQMTQYPEACEAGQNYTTVTTPTGSLLTLMNSTTPPITTNYTLYIALGTIGGLIIFFVLGLIIFMFLTWKAKQKPFRGRLEPEKPEEKTPRLQAFENGFKRIKHPGQMNKPLSREGTPENDDDTPINVMQLLRKDIITPGGRDSPASNVFLSVTTPNPYSYHDGDSIGGGSMPIPEENPALKKHYHVIGGDPSIGGLEEEDEGDYIEADGSRQPPRLDSARSAKAPVMVMPVHSDGSDMFDGDGDEDEDEDDSEVDGQGMYDADGQSSLVAVRQGVGIHEPMCPPSRLPPIDEGPASHRSYTGAGNSGSRKSSGHTATSFSAHSPTIIEEESPRSDTPTSPRAPMEPHHPDLPPRPSSRAETPSGRRSSLGLLYKMEGNMMVAIPDIIEQTMGCGTVGKTEESTKSKAGRKDGAKLKATSRSATRRGSGTFQGIRAISAMSDSKKKRSTTGRPKSRSKQNDSTFADDEQLRPKSSVKMTRVDIPELLPPGELASRPPGENELLESPGRAYANAAYELDVERGQGGDSSRDGSPRKLWLQPVKPTEDVWNRVSHLWRLGQAWSDKPT